MYVYTMYIYLYIFFQSFSKETLNYILGNFEPSTFLDSCHSFYSKALKDL